MSSRMRCAPAVRYPLQRSVTLASVLLGFLLSSFGVLAAWVFWGTNSSWVAALGAGALWMVVCFCVLHFWRHQTLGDLCWDGQVWTLEGGQHKRTLLALSGSPEVFLDLQTHLWVRISPVGHRLIWLWIERSSQPERWMDLRRAVYSRATLRADNADETAPASRRGRES